MHFSAAAAMTPSGVPPIPHSRSTGVSRLAASIAADTSPSEMSRTRAPASRISRWVYANTQSRIHVLVCHAFLRSLVKHDLARSRVGRFAGPVNIDDTPDPMRAASPERTAVRMGG